MTAQVHADPCAKRLIQNVLLVSEAAADIWLDNTDFTDRNTQRLRCTAAYNMRDLGRRNNGYFSVYIYISPGNRKFDMAVGNTWCIVYFIDLHQIFLFVFFFCLF